MQQGTVAPHIPLNDVPTRVLPNPGNFPGLARFQQAVSSIELRAVTIEKTMHLKRKLLRDFPTMGEGGEDDNRAKRIEVDASGRAPILGVDLIGRKSRSLKDINEDMRYNNLTMFEQNDDVTDDELEGDLATTDDEAEEEVDVTEDEVEEEVATTDDEVEEEVDVTDDEVEGDVDVTDDDDDFYIAMNPTPPPEAELEASSALANLRHYDTSDASDGLRILVDAFEANLSKRPPEFDELLTENGIVYASYTCIDEVPDGNWERALFAQRDIGQGEIIAVYIGEVCSSEIDVEGDYLFKVKRLKSDASDQEDESDSEEDLVKDPDYEPAMRQRPRDLPAVAPVARVPRTQHQKDHVTIDGDPNNFPENLAAYANYAKGRRGKCRVWRVCRNGRWSTSGIPFDIFSVPANRQAIRKPGQYCLACFGCSARRSQRHGDSRRLWRRVPRTNAAEGHPTDRTRKLGVQKSDMVISPRALTVGQHCEIQTHPADVALQVVL